MRRTLTEKLSQPGLRIGALPLGSRIALIVFGAVALAALFAPFLTVNPQTSGVPALPPSAEHWFGTDA